jgi:predicted dienelactone hydrolase
VPTAFSCAVKFLAAIAFCFAATQAWAAGFRFIEVPADADGPALHGAMWYPCSEPPAEAGPGGRGCPIDGDKLPLVVISHGRGGTFNGHRDTAGTLADAGFVVAAINHPGDTASDLGHTSELSVFVERPTDIKRLIDFLLGPSSVAARLDPQRIGMFGFSRGGYTGLVVIGAEPHFRERGQLCQQSPQLCEAIRGKPFPHDGRIKAAVIADPLAVFFDADSFAGVKAPVQLWASANGGDGVEPEAVATVDKNLSVPHEYHVVPNSRHFAFLAPCSPELTEKRFELCTDAPRFDRVAFHQQFDADVLAFFRAQLGARRE